ncbi:MAG TPA: hypothetical protein VGB65_07195 [Allosphingosinicella sp.]|jgi:hypothetical protein
MKPGIALTRKNLVRGCIALPLLLSTVYCANFIYETRPRQIIRSLLRLESAPSSLRNVRCESWSITDVTTTCAFEIKPADFPLLLRGWQFVRVPAGGGSYSYAMGPKLGQEFVAASNYSINNPPEFAHGGHVWLIVDSTRSRVQVDYYEE